MGHLGATVFAVLCLAASAAVGAVLHGRHGAGVAGGRAQQMRATVLGLLVLAAAVVAHSVIGLRDASADVDSRLTAFSGEVARLDHALRQAGEAGQPARELLFRYVDRTARDVSPRSAQEMMPDGATTVATLRPQLRAEVERLVADGSTTAHDIRPALEAFLEACTTLTTSRNASVSPWFEAVLLAWLMLGLATLGVLAGPRRTGTLALIALAAGLSLGIYFVDDMAAPLQRVLLASSSRLEDVLHTIAE